MEKTVGWNVKPSPSHMALPICSGLSLQVSLSLSVRGTVPCLWDRDVCKKVGEYILLNYALGFMLY